MTLIISWFEVKNLLGITCIIIIIIIIINITIIYLDIYGQVLLGMFVYRADASRYIAYNWPSNFFIIGFLVVYFPGKVYLKVQASEVQNVLRFLK